MSLPACAARSIVVPVLPASTRATAAPTVAAVAAPAVPSGARGRRGLAVLATRLAAAAGLVGCAAAPRLTPTPVPVAPTPVAVVDSVGPSPAVLGLGAPPPAAAAERFVHTPGLTWDLDVLPYEGHERVQRYVQYFTHGARDRFTEWLSRGTRYDGLVRAKLRAGGLPEDLTYLALVESGYDVQATSHARAVGMWQFMPQTARDVGLRVDWWVDERRDPVRATDAAVRMLKWLKSEFGSYFVAAAAYNGGPGRVSRGLAQLASVDSAGTMPAGDARFFALVERDVLHDETKNYVPQLIAAALVAKEAERYALRPRAVAPLAFDTVRVPALTPLAAVASACHASRADLLDLNPHLLRGLTPPGASFAVRVPSGAGEIAAAHFVALGEDIRRAFTRATTRKRDTWAALAERAGTTRAILEAFNPGLATVRHGAQRGRLVAGQAVRVPTGAVLAYTRDVIAEGDGSGLPLDRAAAADREPVDRETVGRDKAKRTAAAVTRVRTRVPLPASARRRRATG